MAAIVAKMISMMIDPLSIIVAIILIMITKNKTFSVRMSVIIIVGVLWSLLSVWVAAKVNGFEYSEYILNNLPLAFIAFMLLCFIISAIKVAFNKIRNK